MYRTITNGNGNPVMVGNLCYYDPRNVREMYLEGTCLLTFAHFCGIVAGLNRCIEQ